MSIPSIHATSPVSTIPSDSKEVPEINYLQIIRELAAQCLNTFHQLKQQTQETKDIRREYKTSVNQIGKHHQTLSDISRNTALLTTVLSVGSLSIPALNLATPVVNHLQQMYSMSHQGEIATKSSKTQLHLQDLQTKSSHQGNADSASQQMHELLRSLVELQKTVTR